MVQMLASMTGHKALNEGTDLKRMSAWNMDMNVF